MHKSSHLAFMLALVGTVLLSLSYTVATADPATQTDLPSTVSGVVMNTDGIVANAIVQVQGTANRTETDHHGQFTLNGITGPAPVVLTAWSAGHYVGWAALDPAAEDWSPDAPITITLKPLPTTDNYDYGWFSFDGIEGTASCGLCHREYDEWTADLHAGAATNHRFLTMYTGNDVTGNEGQPTELGLDGLEKSPGADQPDYGPGYLLDFPNRTGNCAACHTPVAATTPNNQNCAWSGCHTNLTHERSPIDLGDPVSPLGLKGDAADGISCDFCHKISEVILDPATHLPYPDMPGILSLTLTRPVEGEEVFYGTVLDVNRRVSYLPLQSESEFCAPCHYGVFGGVVGAGTVSGGTVVYNSYGEWLDSPYSDPDTGLTCQDCHMPVVEENWFVFPEQGGLTRDYVQLHDHTMPGAADETLLQNTVTMVSETERSDGALHVKVSITNDQAGHHVPTDVPIRSMILVVNAYDANGNRLTLHEGPINPAYSGDYGGLPGKTYAKVLRDEWTGEAPTGAYWRPVTLVEDTRLAALATDITQYTFDAPIGETITLDVQLLFRRAFYDLMQQKGWDDPDIVMEHETLQIPAD
ncbi:MAG: hypothetical protein JXA10_00715 [Anaerolineae bacterium]|nr:hypothetical protein [Anaerolineae bacterium]